MLTLSSKFDKPTDYLSQNYKVAFNPIKNKLTFRKIGKTRDITNLSTLVEKVNSLQKPIFTGLESYRTCHAHLKSINQIIDRYNHKLLVRILHVLIKIFTLGKRGLKKNKISLKEFNQNLKPTAAQLKNKIWAIHATKHLPEDGILRPFADYAEGAKAKEAIPGIYNTIHFSLGELVRPHSGFTWDNRSMAVLTPLGTLMEQAVNIFTHDTFITGEWALKADSIVLVSQDKDIPKWQDPPFKVVRYNKDEKSLRAAIDEVIRDKGGLAFRMDDNSVLLGSRAMLDEDINVNTESFFENLLEAYKGKLSFGDHTHSSKGDAHLLGGIRQLSTNLMDNLLYPDSVKIEQPARYIGYLVLKAFYDKAKGKYFSAEEQERFERTILDRLKMDPLLLTQQQGMQYLSAEHFNSLNKQELDQFILENPLLFKCYPKEALEPSWAVARWLTVGQEKGLKEGLDKIIDQGFANLAKTKEPLLFLYLILLLNKYANPYSDRAAVMNRILDLKGIKAYKKRMGLILRFALKIQGFPFPSKVKLP
ncbi:hypothetical protein [Parachlamydia sp. AcF125]|uniref:hypothetical protein n=1 Tax=Parachlamydia sp. AcF125 TaxID=2795736 RepID=UPI001BC9B1F3|nr:hypothetical protein [Parachlamydia sp. AcF125]MBS4168082.1 hypothetical protein [Parachlamydia sp. AcF125]